MEAGPRSGGETEKRNDVITTGSLLALPQEVLLYILSYLDLPDLDSLSTVNHALSRLRSDRILHRNRLRIVAPSRVEHSLFAQGCHGTLLRPSVGDLVRMNVMKGLGIERRWRLGNYFYSAQSVKLYESSLRLEQARVIRVLKNHLSKRIQEGNTGIHVAVVTLPSEAESPLISRRLLPVIASLKWSMKRDKVTRRLRARPPEKGMITDMDHFRSLLEGSGRSLIRDGERVRLAVCPGIRRIVKFFEEMAVAP
ncbi:hypothetical protein CPB86DRAFT_806919 [Serendipita vermifera]|nr:hypothetical protein CPB86DRAFT_806919 [Serendipita vermifera]